MTVNVDLCTSSVQKEVVYITLWFVMDSQTVNWEVMSSVETVVESIMKLVPIIM